MMGQRRSCMHLLETKYKTSNAVEGQNWLGVPCPRIGYCQPSPSLTSQSCSRFYMYRRHEQRAAEDTRPRSSPFDMVGGCE